MILSITFVQLNKINTMNLKSIFKICLFALFLVACKDDGKDVAEEITAAEFSYNVEQFADIKILRYQSQVGKT